MPVAAPRNATRPHGAKVRVRRARILALYRRGLTYTAIGKRENITGQRASRIVDAALVNETRVLRIIAANIAVLVGERR